MLTNIQPKWDIIQGSLVWRGLIIYIVRYKLLEEIKYDKNKLMYFMCVFKNSMR